MEKWTVECMHGIVSSVARLTFAKHFEDNRVGKRADKYGMSVMGLDGNALIA